MKFHQVQVIMIINYNRNKIILLKTYFMDKKKGLIMTKIWMKTYKTEFNNKSNLFYKCLKVSKAVINCVNIQEIYEIWTKYEKIQIITCPHHMPTSH